MRLVVLFLLTAALFAQQDLNSKLTASRQRINAIDDQIVKLFNERAQVVREVGMVKQQFHAPVNAPDRNQQVLARVSAQARAPLTPEAVSAIYRTIIQEMSAMETIEMDKAVKHD
jgi:chorismate mutase / prephenate dehydratase